MLLPDDHGNLAAADGRRLHWLTNPVIAALRATAPMAAGERRVADGDVLQSVGLVMDLYLANALAPAVILIRNRPASRAIGAALLDALLAVLSTAPGADASVGAPTLSAIKADGASAAVGMRVIRDTDVREVRLTRAWVLPST